MGRKSPVDVIFVSVSVRQMGRRNRSSSGVVCGKLAFKWLAKCSLAALVGQAEIHVWWKLEKALDEEGLEEEDKTLGVDPLLG
uniref:Uncharacterized protein n=1 Tax=Sphaerodactylus townsendi TaxID=933632 RepID=A0ACB8FDV0_9SAUR